MLIKSGIFLVLSDGETNIYLLLSRIIGGFTHGLAYVTVIVHSSENATKEFREFLLIIVGVVINYSILMSVFSFFHTEGLFSSGLLNGIGLFAFGICAMIITAKHATETIPFILQNNGSEMDALQTVSKLKKKPIAARSVHHDFLIIKNLVQDEMDYYGEPEFRKVLLPENRKSLMFCFYGRLCSILSFNLPLIVMIMLFLRGWVDESVKMHGIFVENTCLTAVEANTNIEHTFTEKPSTVNEIDITKSATEIRSKRHTTQQQEIGENEKPISKESEKNVRSVNGIEHKENESKKKNEEENRNNKDHVTKSSENGKESKMEKEKIESKNVSIENTEKPENNMKEKENEKPEPISKTADENGNKEKNNKQEVRMNNEETKKNHEKMHSNETSEDNHSKTEQTKEPENEKLKKHHSKLQNINPKTGANQAGNEKPKLHKENAIVHEPTQAPPKTIESTFFAHLTVILHSRELTLVLLAWFVFGTLTVALLYTLNLRRYIYDISCVLSIAITLTGLVHSFQFLSSILHMCLMVYFNYVTIPIDVFGHCMLAEAFPITLKAYSIASIASLEHFIHIVVIGLYMTEWFHDSIILLMCIVSFVSHEIARNMPQKTNLSLGKAREQYQNIDLMLFNEPKIANNQQQDFI